MKKMIILLSAFIFLLDACSKKDDLNPNNVGNPIPPPTPSLSLKADTAWYNGSATIIVTSNAQSITNLNNNQIVNGSVVITGLMNDSILNFMAKNTNGTLTSTTTASITVHNHSERMTLWCNYGSFHQTYGKWCYMDSLQYPFSWHDIPPDCNTLLFFPNGTGLVTYGPCASYPGQSFPATWSFQNNETIFFDGLQQWTIDYVNTNEFQVYKIELVINDPNNRSAKTVLRYSH